MGLAEIAVAEGDKKRALQLFRQALAKEWPPHEEAKRRRAQLDYAWLLAGAGKRAEAVALLLSVIDQRGDDPAVSNQAAGKVSEIGSAEQAEQGYSALAGHFPGDASAWIKLGDARFAAGKDALALDAYRRALAADSGNAGAHRSLARLEESLRLDPTRKGLSVRERSQRWEEILRRAVDAAAACGPTPDLEKAKVLLKQKAVSLRASDERMEMAREIWRTAPTSCHTDVAVAHIMSKLAE